MRLCELAGLFSLFLCANSLQVLRTPPRVRYHAASNNVDLFSSDSNPFVKMLVNKTEAVSKDNSPIATSIQATSATPIVNPAVFTEEQSASSLFSEQSEQSNSEKQADRLKGAADRLRREAAAMEVALVEDAKAKGIPEEIIKQYVSIRQPSSKPTEQVAPAKKAERVPSTPQEVRARLSYLPIGDAARMTSEMTKLKDKD
eukprot:gene32481-39270_t